jgi:hypothetical protein
LTKLQAIKNQMYDPDDQRKLLIEYEAIKLQYKDLVIQKLCGGVDLYSFMVTRIIDKQAVKIYTFGFCDYNSITNLIFFLFLHIYLD